VFSPFDFLNLAKDLINDNEAKIRTAISRAYYSSFLIARDTFSLSEKTPKVHRKVVSILYSRNPIVANQLHLLRRKRNFADYDTKVVLSRNDAENAIKLAEDIITGLRAGSEL